MFKEIGDELADFIAWVKEKLADSDMRREIATDLGLQPGASVPEANLPSDKLDSIERYRSQANPDREAFFILLNDVRALWEAGRAFIRSLGVSEITALNETVYRLFEVLASNYFRLRHPKFYFAALLADALAEDSSAIDESDYTIERFFRSLARLIEFLLSPIGFLYQSVWFGVKDEAEARRVSERTFTHLAAFLVIAKSIDAVAALGTREVIFGWDSLIKDPPSPGDRKTPKADEISERMLSFALVNRDKDRTTGQEIKKSVNVSLAVVPQSHGASGFFIAVGGSGQVETPLSDKWKLRAELSSPSSAAFLIQKELDKDKWSFSADGPNEARAILSVVATPDPSGVSYRIPNADETRLELGKLSFSIVLSPDKTELKAAAERCALVIAARDNDGFIGSLLPEDGVRIPIDFGIGYSDARGFFTEGNIPFLSGRSTRSGRASRPFGPAAAPDSPPLPTLSAGKAPQLGLAQVIPVGRSLGPVTIKQVLLGMFPVEDPASPAVAAEVSTSLVIELGPVLATVDRIGFQFRLDFPKSGGNLGFADIALGVKPPLGVGLKVDSALATGGGFLAFDPERGQYAGVVDLNLEGGIAVKGMGLIATRLPGNVKGFSLLVIITATAEGFEPVPLPLGFRLTGIGGLLAVNRTFDQEVLAAGLKSRTLESVMFPQDPVRNAPQVLSALNRVFPPAAGHHLFGPMARIEWGKETTLITADLALVLEFGARLRLLILARILAVLPRPEHDLVRLQMDAMGVVDFDQGTAALDATLYDSRLLNKFVLTGDMAMRLKWEASPHFALAIGGLHPAFNPPLNFPKLERIAINLAAGDNPRIRCEAYFALTANTVQFGSRAELYAAAAGFSIQGEIGFDVLIQLDPFFFLADFHAQVQLKRGSTNLFKVRVEGALAGPRPLHLKAKATFEVLWWDVSIRVDRTLVEGEKPPAPEPIDVLPRLKEALSNPANWRGQLPEGARPMVTLRPRASSEVLLHPLGTLTVKQGVVPLDMEISRFGSAVPAGARRFAISSVSLGGQPQKARPVKDFFAPAQFFEMSDDAKLSRPSFELMTAGVGIGAEEIVLSANPNDWLEVGAIEFDTIIVDKEKGESRPSAAPARYSLSAQLLNRQARFGAAGASELRRSGRAKYRAAVGKYRVEKVGWQIVATEDLAVQPMPGLEANKPATYSEAAQALEAFRRRDPAKAAGLKILRSSELL